jgi:hypothetical protein
MFTDSTPLGCIIVLIITSWWPFAMFAYEDLGSLCLGSYEMKIIVSHFCEITMQKKRFHNIIMNNFLY